MLAIGGHYILSSFASREAGDMLAACYLSQSPLIEAGDIFCRVIAANVT